MCLFPQKQAPGHGAFLFILPQRKKRGIIHLPVYRTFTRILLARSNLQIILIYLFSNNNEQKYTVLSGGWDRRVCIWRVPVTEL